jgi:hypothetical protein
MESKAKLFTVHCSLFIVHCSLFIVHCSLFTVHCSLFTVHCYNLQSPAYQQQPSLAGFGCVLGGYKSVLGIEERLLGFTELHGGVGPELEAVDGDRRVLLSDKNVLLLKSRSAPGRWRNRYTLVKASIPPPTPTTPIQARRSSRLFENFGLPCGG